jgi:ABC-2 type transport system ATP-binding protein
MDEVEHCGRIALMNEGRIVREGAPSELKRGVFSEPVYEMEAEDAPAAFKKSKDLCGETAEISLHGASLHIVLKAGAAIDDIADSLRKAGINVSDPKEVEPTMEDVFVKTIKT